jgi:hypothetical protein
MTSTTNLTVLVLERKRLAPHRRPVWTLSSGIRDRGDQNRSTVRARQPAQPHQLRTERGYHQVHCPNGGRSSTSLRLFHPCCRKRNHRYRRALRVAILPFINGSADFSTAKLVIEQRVFSQLPTSCAQSLQSIMGKFDLAPAKKVSAIKSDPHHPPRRVASWLISDTLQLALMKGFRMQFRAALPPNFADRILSTVTAKTIMRIKFPRRQPSKADANARRLSTSDQA